MEWTLVHAFRNLLVVTIVSLMMAVIAWAVMRVLNYGPNFGSYFINIWWATLFLMILTKIFRFLTGR